MRPLRGVATGIPVVSVLVALIAIAVIVVGVLVVAQSTFNRLMIQAGTPAADAQSMFDHGIATTVLIAVVIAVAISVALAVIVPARMAMPLPHMGRAAERVAAGGYRGRGQPSDEKDIEVDVAVPAGRAARAEPDGVAQVLANLLQNASRYTPRGGRTSIHAEDQRSRVLVSITNTGDGIPADDLPHVFERFYRVEKSRDAARGGAGIGLAIVKQLVEASGGRVGADSNGRFTRFCVSLPAA